MILLDGRNIVIIDKYKMTCIIKNIYNKEQPTGYIIEWYIIIIYRLVLK